MKQEMASAPESLKELFKKALLVRERAYAPYSLYKVGAAIRTSTGEIFTGCNVENASYGGSICAERAAVLKAVSEKGKIAITQVMVVTQADPAWPPCGMCRQVIAEFEKNTEIYASTVDGLYEEFDFEDLLPHAFTPAYLNRDPKK
jgi:cytidine deaminase